MIDPVVFPLNNVQRIGGSVMFSTDVQEGLSGFEVRSANWEDSRHRFNATPGIRTLEHLRLVRAFHYACNGMEIGFLLRDWSDYEATQTASMITDGGGAFERGVTQEVPDSSGFVFQMQKLYSNGYREHRRTIRRPQSGTVTVYNSSGVLMTSGYSVNYTTGRITLDVEDDPPYWAGSFYVPVRFESDAIDWELIRYSLTSKKGLNETPEVTLIEEREL